MNYIVIVWEAVPGTLLPYLPLKASNSRYIDVSNHSPIRLPMMQDQKSLSLSWRSLSRWGRECVALSSAYKGSQYWDYIQQLLIHFSHTWLTGSQIVDAPCTLILPRVYLQYATIHFGIVYQSWSHGSHSSLFMYVLFYHHSVLFDPYKYIL